MSQECVVRLPTELGWVGLGSLTHGLYDTLGQFELVAWFGDLKPWLLQRANGNPHGSLAILSERHADCGFPYQKAKASPSSFPLGKQFPNTKIPLAMTLLTLVAQFGLASHLEYVGVALPLRDCVLKCPWFACPIRQ